MGQQAHIETGDRVCGRNGFRDSPGDSGKESGLPPLPPSATRHFRLYESENRPRRHNDDDRQRHADDGARI
jgi:hypothetical protein